MTENKRFTMCHEQNDINGWTMSIIDWETKEPFNYTTYEVHSSSITDTRDEMEDLCLLLNELNDENEQLKQFKEKVFALIDKEIARNEEAIKWEKETIADSGSIEVYNYMLNRLKNELQEMTETKRFLIDYAGELIDLNNHKFIDYGDECCKLLNDLHDENQELKKKNKQLSICEKRIIELKNENEQLKQHNTELINKIDFLERAIDGDIK